MLHKIAFRMLELLRRQMRFRLRFRLRPLLLNDTTATTTTTATATIITKNTLRLLRTSLSSLLLLLLISLLIVSDLRIRYWIHLTDINSNHSNHIHANKNDLVSLSNYNASSLILLPLDYSNLPSEYSHILNEPYYMVYLTRRCKKTCSFLSRDKRTGRPFTQYKGEHVWLSEDELDVLMKRKKREVVYKSIDG